MGNSTTHQKLAPDSHPETTSGAENAAGTGKLFGAGTILGTFAQGCICKALGDLAGGRGVEQRGQGWQCRPKSHCAASSNIH